MTTKQLFIEKQPELATYLRGIAQSTQFQLALIPVDSAVFQSAKNADVIEGARLYKEALLTLAIPDEPEAESQPQPGLIDPSFPNSVTRKQETKPKA
jgi:hypothetical protein